MRNLSSNKSVGLALWIVLALAVLVSGTTWAQQWLASTEPGGDPATVLPPSYDSGNPASHLAGLLPPDDNQPARPMDGSQSAGPAAVSAVFSYYQVSGTTLRGRSSATGYIYDGAGCTHVTSGTGTGRILNTELTLPDGAVIKYLRVYYRDTNAANGVEGYITRYQPGVGTADLIHTGSSDAFTGGYGFVVSAEITETVNNAIYTYTLIGWPDDANVNNQICGLRVAYYAPVGQLLYLPILRQ